MNGVLLAANVSKDRLTTQAINNISDVSLELVKG